MRNWYNIFPKNLSLSIYVWIIFSLLPFYFIFRSTSMWEMLIGIVLIVMFFTSYRLSFLKIGGALYVWVGIMMAISIGLTIFYGYIYFSLFLAFFIGNVQPRAGFFTLYVVHLVTTIIAAYISFFTQQMLFFNQLPFFVITVLGVILLPFNMYNRIKQEKLETQLDDANKKISQLIVFEERQRIARDLHDTLGQKLSLIGLKSDLAGRLSEVDVAGTKNELADINQTARTALKEVRDMVSNMRGAKLEDELNRIEQILKAAEIDFQFIGDSQLSHSPLLVEDVLCMCLKESINNVVRHSQATQCSITVGETTDKVRAKIKDDGVGMSNDDDSISGNGLRGMRERLEFVNGKIQMNGTDGTSIEIEIPNVIQQLKQEERV
ncbi:sensor histidine kinase [Halalkalibacillus sediminis]|uniref:histidine kinase n=2 Tax=Halalkalibacillus sediminis TaxID=2018042 RepID=A0A2I0QRN1_9BACI|nr:sensor histidine kinase [Halalkalibacillus sediminis]PKR76991.1 sensor histidine kinase [Halalkalibacillus sediminis]